jgi:hypothetical protein
MKGFLVLRFGRLVCEFVLFVAVVCFHLTYIVLFLIDRAV